MFDRLLMLEQLGLMPAHAPAGKADSHEREGLMRSAPSS
jgi:hypothetical protein